MQEDRRTAWRTDPRGLDARSRHHVLVYVARCPPWKGRSVINRPTTGRPIEILLVEDNPGDVRLTIEGLKESKVRNNLHVASDGVDAIEFLRREGRHGGAVRPDLILLDLNLPRMDGREVLSEIKSDPKLKTIPVVVLTTLRSEQDVLP